MVRGRASGYTLTNSDAAVVLGMVARGDRDHDIAVYCGVNQKRPLFSRYLLVRVGEPYSADIRTVSEPDNLLAILIAAAIGVERS
jgi:hypothetical protein